MMEYLPDGTCYKSGHYYNVYHNEELLESSYHEVVNTKGWLSRDEVNLRHELQGKWMRELELPYSECRTVYVDNTEVKIEVNRKENKCPRGVSSPVEDDGFRYSAIVLSKSTQLQTA